METEASQLKKQLEKKSASESDGREIAQGTSDVAVKGTNKLFNQR
jgi:hypothetical protein